MWPLLGWFCFFMCVGSLVGAATWVVQMRSNDLGFQSSEKGLIPQRSYDLNSIYNRWYSVFYMLYPVELTCVIISKLLLLYRLTKNASHGSQAQLPQMNSVRRKWMIGRSLPTVFRVMAVVVMMCSVACMAAYCAAAFVNEHVADAYSHAAAACDSDGNDTNSSLSYNNEADRLIKQASTAESLESAFEAVALVLLTVGYVVLVSLSVAIFRITERLASLTLISFEGRAEQIVDATKTMVKDSIEDTKQAAVHQRRRLVIACVIVMVTFPVRAAFDLMLTYSQFNVSFNAECGQCDACQSQQLLVSTWLVYTPEIQPIIVALSSPFPLILSLWLVTQAHARAAAIAKNLQRARVDINI